MWQPASLAPAASHLDENFAALWHLPKMSSRGGIVKFDIPDRAACLTCSVIYIPDGGIDAA